MNRAWAGDINSAGQHRGLPRDVANLNVQVPPNRSNRRGQPFVNTYERIEDVENLIQFFGFDSRRQYGRRGPKQSWTSWTANLTTQERAAKADGRMYMKVALTLSLQFRHGGNPDLAVNPNYNINNRYGTTFVCNDTSFFKADRTKFLKNFEELLAKLKSEYRITQMFDLERTRRGLGELRVRNNEPVNGVDQRVNFGADYQNIFLVKVRIKWVSLPTRNRWPTNPITTANVGARFTPDVAAGVSERFGCYIKDSSAIGTRIDKFLRKKKSLIFMSNADSACFPRSLLICLMKMYLKPGGDNVSKATEAELEDCGIMNYLREGGYTNDNAYRSIIKGTKLQLQLAIVLCKHAGTDFRSPTTWNDIAVFEACFKVQLRVFDSRCRLKKCYEGNPRYETKVYMVSNRLHFHPLLSRKGLMSRNYECKSCDVLYDHIDDHQGCRKRCFYCREVPCAGVGRLPSGSWMKCRECLRAFPNLGCLEQHRSRGNSGRSVCDRVKSCGEFTCRLFDPKDYDDISTHHCSDVKCSNCRKLCNPSTHMCAMKRTKAKKHEERFLFFDFECSQETSNDGIHVVTHVVVKDECDVTTAFLPSVGDEAPVINRFCDWILATSGRLLPKDKGVTAIAHNGRGYDFQFILQWALNNNNPPTHMIRSGQKIMSMVVGGVRFIDSLSFLTMPLSVFPKTFGLKELAKGFFPHLFNTRNNVGYVGMIPEAHYFIPSGMSTKGRRAFMTWYESVKHTTDWDFDHEILKYCTSDVDILRRGCLSFRDIFIEETGVDPFSHITIAGACMSTFRSKYLEEESIFPLRRSLDSWVRRGFFGGRTQVFKAHAVAGENESIKYVDVMSLYPWVNTNCEYPLGAYTWKEHVHPLTSESSITTELQAFGLFEVDVTAPTTLLHPVLPHRREDGTLLFDLTPKTNAVYATPELRLAISKGYVVTKVHASLTWGSTTTSLFRDYMLSFLKIKQEASGWSDKSLRGTPVETDADKLEWLEKHRVKEGVSLDMSKVKHNPGLRAVSKLCLNSLWGKLGQREVRKKTEYIEETDKICKLLESSEVHDIIEFGESIHEVSYSKDISDRELKFDTPANWNTSAALAAFTTSHARVKLYSALDIVQERALYCDTDSVIYVHTPDKPGIDIGDTLGCWTDELGGDDIQEFIGAGPKTYAYRTMSGKEEVKCKGFTVSYVNSKGCLSFDNFKRVVFHKYSGGSEEPILITTTPFKIVRDKTTKGVSSVCNVKKVFSATLERKGVVSDDLRVLPFGHNLFEDT